jgi:hypothetical protein
MDKRFGLRNARSMYRVGSLMTVSREQSRYVRSSASARGQMEEQWYPTFFYEKGMRIMH